MRTTQEQRDALRAEIGELPDEGHLHWADCWLVHPECTILALLDDLAEAERERDELRAALAVSEAFREDLGRAARSAHKEAVRSNARRGCYRGNETQCRQVYCVCACHLEARHV